jgi:hypothetical protein
MPHLLLPKRLFNPPLTSPPVFVETFPCRIFDCIASIAKFTAASRFNRLANPQRNKVVCMLGRWFVVSIPHHNIEAFMSMGLISVEREGRIFLTVVPEKVRRLRESAEFEPAEKSFPPDDPGRFRLQTRI